MFSEHYGVMVSVSQIFILGLMLAEKEYGTIAEPFRTSNVYIADKLLLPCMELCSLKEHLNKIPSISI